MANFFLFKVKLTPYYLEKFQQSKKKILCGLVLTTRYMLSFSIFNKMVDV